MIGQTIAHYQVLEKLGQGGMGVVYKARDTRLQRLVALKVLSSDKVVSSDRRARFIREAQSASALNNPHIVTIYDAHAYEGVDYLAMEYIEGRTLDKLVSRRGLPVGETLRLALPIADALTAAHAAGIIHRDLKPGNIMVANGGQVKVLDFGLAKRIDHGNSSDDGGTQTMGETEPATGEGTVLGTAAYMSPEQAAGKPVDARTDIFSFGAVLYEMLTGRRPFAGDSWSSTLAAVLRDEPKPLGELVPGIPPELERIVARCLRKELDRRFQHMADIKVALAELKEESDSGVSQRQSPAATSVRTTAPRWRNVTIAAACVALSLGISAWWLIQKRSASVPVITTAPIRLTYDSGLTKDPSISGDGKLVTYSSDRAGSFDIYLQQIGGGPPIRVAGSPYDEEEPSFSPDGTQIVYRSNENGGGVYVIPTFGGDARRIAKRGFRPKFSPDGRQIAYWTGTDPVVINPDCRVEVVPSNGGTPRRIRTDFVGVAAPLWTPDGSHLLVVGLKDTHSWWEWWTTDLQGSEPVRAGINEATHLVTPNPTGVGASTWWKGRSAVFGSYFRDNKSLEHTVFVREVDSEWRPTPPVLRYRKRESAIRFGERSCSVYEHCNERRYLCSSY